MNNPFFSIIVPVYNVERYLQDCLDSVSKQSFQNFEIIIVDDGSTDNSSAVCDTYAETYRNATVIHQTNGGLSSARNTGINTAKGDYLIFLDSDDFLIHDDSLDRIAESLKRNQPELLICLPDEYDATGKEVMIHHPVGKWSENTVFQSSEIVNQLYEINGIWVTLAQTKIIKRNYCVDNGLMFYEGIYHEDDEWIAHVLMSNPTIAFYYRPWYGYRHRENSIVSSLETDKLYKKACDKIKVASSMLNQDLAKNYSAYVRYASDYLLNTIISANQFDEDKQTEFLNFLKEYKKCYKKVFYSKDMKLILKAMYIIAFGEKKFINKYKG